MQSRCRSRVKGTELKGGGGGWDGDAGDLTLLQSMACLVRSYKS